MNISAWTVYWVMMLDSIGGFLGFVTFVLLAIAAAIAIRRALNDDGVDFKMYLATEYPSVHRQSEHDEIIKALSKRGNAYDLARRLVFIALAIGAANSFIPSTKVAAAMFILPRLTSDQVIEPVGKEARELYDLAKKALTKLAEDDEPKAKQ